MEPAVVLKDRSGMKRREVPFAPQDKVPFALSLMGSTANDTAVHAHMHVYCEQTVSIDCMPAVDTQGPHDNRLSPDNLEALPAAQLHTAQGLQN